MDAPVPHRSPFSGSIMAAVTSGGCWKCGMMTGRCSSVEGWFPGDTDWVHTSWQTCRNMSFRREHIDWLDVELWLFTLLFIFFFSHLITNLSRECGAGGVSTGMESSKEADWPEKRRLHSVRPKFYGCSKSDFKVRQACIFSGINFLLNALIAHTWFFLTNCFQTHILFTLYMWLLLFASVLVYETRTILAVMCSHQLDLQMRKWEKSLRSCSTAPSPLPWGGKP